MSYDRFNEFENKEYDDNNNNTLQYNKVGGFPIQNLITEGTRDQFGGNTDLSSKFTNLVIPTGLVIEEQMKGGNIQKYKIQDATEEINHKLFDSLFEDITTIIKKKLSKTKHPKSDKTKTRKIIKK